LVLTFASTGVVILISRQVFSFLSCNTLSNQFASVVWSVIIGTSHIIVVSLTFMTLSGLRPYLSVTCKPICCCRRHHHRRIYCLRLCCHGHLCHRHRCEIVIFYILLVWNFQVNLTFPLSGCDFNRWPFCLPTSTHCSSWWMLLNNRLLNMNAFNLKMAWKMAWKSRHC
jgi:hypothetical protein